MVYWTQQIEEGFTMWKFSELPYERVDVDAFIANGLKLIETFEQAKTAEEAIAA